MLVACAETVGNATIRADTVIIRIRDIADILDWFVEIFTFSYSPYFTAITAPKSHILSCRFLSNLLPKLIKKLKLNNVFETKLSLSIHHISLSIHHISNREENMIRICI